MTDNLPTNLDDLRELRIRVERAIGKIEDKRRDAEHRAMIGKCFKYRNSYGGERPTWWFYQKITGVKNGGLVALTFEMTSAGIITIEPAKIYADVLGGSIVITAAEFRRQWQKLQKRLASTTP